MSKASTQTPRKTPGRARSVQERAKPKRASLSCRRIAELALQIVDETGVESLSMRVLAKRCGVEAMSLYSHFQDKDELLGAVAGVVLDELVLPSPGLAPRVRLAKLCCAYRDLGHRHPKAFALVMLNTRQLSSVLRPIEHALTAFIDAGLPTRRAISAQRILLGYVRGYTLWEVGGFLSRWRGEPGGPPRAGVHDVLAQLDAAAFPTIVGCADLLVKFDPDVEFRQGVGFVLDRLLERENNEKGAGVEGVRPQRSGKS